MIRIGPASDGWAAQAAERLRPSVAGAPGAARFELPDLAADDAEERRDADAPDAPPALAPWLGGPNERVDPPRERGDGGAGAKGERGGALERREAGPAEHVALQRREAPDEKNMPKGDVAAQQVGADDEPTAELGEELRAGRERAARGTGSDATATPRRSEATPDAVRARTNDGPGHSARTDGPVAPEVRPAKVAEPQGTQAQAKPGSSGAQAAASEAKAAAPTTAPTTAQAQAAVATPAAPTAMALNAELARLLALTEGEEPLAPVTGTAAPDGDLAALAASGANVRGGHVSPQRVAPAMPAKDIAAQITEALAGLSGDADGDQVIRLDGAEVGRFLAHVQVSGKDLLVQLSAHDAAARLLLAERAPEVRAELERAGVVAGGVDVRADADGGGGAGRRDGERDGEPTAAQGVTGARAAGRRRGVSGAVAPGHGDGGQRRERVDLIA